MKLTTSQMSTAVAIRRIGYRVTITESTRGTIDGEGEFQEGTPTVAIATFDRGVTSRHKCTDCHLWHTTQHRLAMSVEITWRDGKLAGVKETGLHLASDCSIETVLVVLRERQTFEENLGAS